MTEAEREWVITYLKTSVPENIARLIRIALAEPRMPDEPTEGILRAIIEGYQDWTGNPNPGSEFAKRVHRALHAHLSKPATKTVWDIQWADGCWSRERETFDAAIEEVKRHNGGRYTAFTITPREVPA